MNKLFCCFSTLTSIINTQIPKNETVPYQTSKHGEVGQQFHTEANAYANSRKPASTKVFDLIAKTVIDRTGKKDFASFDVLDLGCGTGISTRALFEKGFKKILGIDISDGMLEKAREFAEANSLSIPKTNYFLGSAEEIDQALPKRKFDLISAFAAFHWFCTEKALTQIKTALKTDGLFVIVENDLAPQNFEGSDQIDKRELWELIGSLKGSPVNDPKAGFDPISVLEKNGFKVEHYLFSSEEIRTLEDAVERKTSFSGWCGLSEEEKKRGLPLLKELLEKQIARQNFGDGKFHETKKEHVLIAYRA
jgi:ubiquinone/menaquinone biosynthesis C-methylase UbiE